MEEDFSDSLLRKNEIQKFSEKSDIKGFVKLAQHIGALMVTGLGLLFIENSVLFGALFIFHGLLLAFLFCPLHEATHLSAFKTKKYNDLTATVCGFLTANSRYFYKYFHFAHHRYTQDPAKDPELAISKPETIFEYAIWISGWYYWKGKLGTMISFAISGIAKEPYIPKNKEKIIIRECRYTIIGYVLIVAIFSVVSPLLLITLWVGPIIIGQVFLRLYLLAEHHNCRNGPGMLEKVRTIKAGYFVNWLAWNMPFHTEHHLFPSVPFHALPKVHLRVHQSLKNVGSSHVAFNLGYVRSLSLF